MVSDNPLCFQSEAYQNFVAVMGFQAMFTLPYTAQTNSYSEGLVKQLKKALRACHLPRKLLGKLPLASLSLYASLHMTVKVPPAQAVFALNFCLLGQFFDVYALVTTGNRRIRHSRFFQSSQADTSTETGAKLVLRSEFVKLHACLL